MQQQTQPSPSSAPRRQSMMGHHELLRQDPEASALAEQLKTIGARLGSAAELPGDEEEARALGHRLRNLMCGLMLRAQLSNIS